MIPFLSSFSLLSISLVLTNHRRVSLISLWNQDIKKGNHHPMISPPSSHSLYPLTPHSSMTKLCSLTVSLTSLPLISRGPLKCKQSYLTTKCRESSSNAWTVDNLAKNPFGGVMITCLVDHRSIAKVKYYNQSQFVNGWSQQDNSWCCINRDYHEQG